VNKAEFSLSLLQSSVSHNPLVITIITKVTFLGIEPHDIGVASEIYQMNCPSFDGQNRGTFTGYFSAHIPQLLDVIWVSCVDNVSPSCM